MELLSALSDRYRIERELGRGGMATVYLAEDVRHNRKVAVKVLHPELAAVLGAERFLAEIRVTAALQHSHILPLFDSGQSDGQLYYVMPFVEGESLRSRLDRERQLPIDDAVMLAKEVANALDYAHRHGVIHRDIKPENILLHDGHAVVADFGIALAVTNAGGGRLTQTGLSLGTPQYMSPEQATGERTIDKRTDVYSLGAVLYEMLTGDPPHTGSTVQAIIARVLTERPRTIRAVRPNVPEHLAFAVEHALEKIPADRWNSAHDFADAVDGKAPSGQGHATGSTVVSPDRPPWIARLKEPLMISLAAIAVAAIAVSAYEWRAAHRVVDSPTIEFPIKLADRSTTQTLLQSFAISPDGKVVAFIARGANGQHQVFTRALNDSRPRPLIGTDGAFSVFFSPDGKWIGFGAGGRIRKVSIEGGSVLPVGTIQGIYGGATWAPGGEIVVSMSSGGLYALKESGGGAPRKVCKTGLAKTSLIEALPVATPDPDRVLFTNFETQSPAGAKIAIASLSSGECKVFDFAGVNALGMIDGLLLYTTAEGVVMAVPFNDRRHESTGSPVPVLTDFEVNQTTGAASASMSRNGSLVFASGLTPVEVQLVDIHGQSQPLLGEQLSYAYPRFSPDGRKIAITIGTPGQRDVWVYDLQSKTSVRISSEGDGEVNERPEWTPDGRSVLYRSSRGKRAGLWWRRVDLSEREKPLLVNDREDYWEVVMTPDGKGIVYQLDTAGADILYRQLNGDTVPKPIAATTAIESMGRVSPDGRWIAYVTPESGTDQVVVQAFPQSAGQIQVSIGSGREPVWSHDGTRLYYRDDRHIVEARFTTAPSFAVTSRQTLFDDTFLRAPFHANYDVTPDGTHFMFLKATDDAELITVYNWIADVRRKLRERASN